MTVLLLRLRDRDLLFVAFKVVVLVDPMSRNSMYLDTKSQFLSRYQELSSATRLSPMPENQDESDDGLPDEFVPDFPDRLPLRVSEVTNGAYTAQQRKAGAHLDSDARKKRAVFPYAAAAAVTSAMYRSMYAADFGLGLVSSWSDDGW